MLESVKIVKKGGYFEFYEDNEMTAKVKDDVQIKESSYYTP